MNYNWFENKNNKNENWFDNKKDNCKSLDYATDKMAEVDRLQTIVVNNPKFTGSEKQRISDVAKELREKIGGIVSIKNQDYECAKEVDNIEYKLIYLKGLIYGGY